jgi:pimeloyl-ACP methyl ester carboxylesterase
MVNKTLLSLAIAVSTAGLTACNLSSTADSDAVATDPILAGTVGFEAESTAVIFSAARGDLPVNTDFLFANAATTDGTAAISDSSAVTKAINDLAGFSATASIYVNFTAALDADTVIAGSSVWLIELKSKEDNASIDALDLKTIVAANPSNPFADGADQLMPGVDYAAEYIELDGRATPSIRINPLKPLDPKTKYIVVVTDKLKDVNGKTVVSSAEYSHVSSNQGLISPALAPVRGAVQGWEQLAGGFLAVATGATQTQDNVILSYAFTTGAGPDVLKNYAAPSLFISGQLPLASAEVLMEGVQEGSTTLIAQSIAQATNQDPDDEAVIAAIKLTDVYAGKIFAVLSAADLEAVIGSSVTIDGTVNRPAPREVNLINADAVDAALNSAGKTDGASPKTFLGTADSVTRYIQGQIQLPDFLGAVTLTTQITAEGIPAAMAADPTWAASTSIGAILDGALGQPAGTTPPKDTDGTTNVTYRYPFPQSVGTNYSPLMITMPAAVNYSAGGAGSDCSTGYDDGFPVVIYVHGITGARTNGLVYTAGLAANCIASVAIDLPLHGIAPITTDSNGNDIDNVALPFTVQPNLAALTGSPYAAIAAGAGTTFDNLTEQHDSITQNSSGIRLPMDFNGTVNSNGTNGTFASGKSGSTIINLSNFSRSRDNMRQAIVDLLNLNASLGNIDTALGGSKLNLGKVFVAGHSLGAIFATTFVSVINDPAVLAANSNLNKVQGVILANGGGQLTKLLENSPSFGPTILGSLAASGLTQGSSNLEKYFYVLQSALDSVDPVVTGKLLAETDTPVVLFNMVGGDALPDDAGGISYPDGFKVARVFLPDHTVPNFDYFADTTTNPYAAFASALGLASGIPTAKAPMAGTNGLAGVMGLKVVNQATDISQLTPPLQVVTRLSTGTHSTFANADAPAAFAEMLGQSVSLIKGSFKVANSAVLEASN